jgi:hypothetical protein
MEARNEEELLAQSRAALEKSKNTPSDVHFQQLVDAGLIDTQGRIQTVLEYGVDNSIAKAVK